MSARFHTLGVKFGFPVSRNITSHAGSTGSHISAAYHWWTVWHFWRQLCYLMLWHQCDWSLVLKIFPPYMHANLNCVYSIDKWFWKAAVFVAMQLQSRVGRRGSLKHIVVSPYHLSCNICKIMNFPQGVKCPISSPKLGTIWRRLQVWGWQANLGTLRTPL